MYGTGLKETTGANKGPPRVIPPMQLGTRPCRQASPVRLITPELVVTSGTNPELPSGTPLGVLLTRLRGSLAQIDSRGKIDWKEKTYYCQMEPQTPERGLHCIDVSPHPHVVFFHVHAYSVPESEYERPRGPRTPGPQAR